MEKKKGNGSKEDLTSSILARLIGFLAVIKADKRDGAEMKGSRECEDAAEKF